MDRHPRSLSYLTRPHNSIPRKKPAAGLGPFLLDDCPGATGRGANTAWRAGLSNLFWWLGREKGVAGMIASQVLPFGDMRVLGSWFGTEKAICDGLE